MQFPFIKKEQTKKNYFLSLLIKPYSIGAILFEEINSTLTILSTHEAPTDNETSKLAGEELVKSFDKVISFVEGSLPEGEVVEKTIFSVPHAWIDDGKIKKDFLLVLKKACDDLGLVPVGYLVSIEAIVNYLQDQEGAPVSAVFFEVARNEVITYIVKGSKIIESKSAETTDGIIKTSEELLRQISSVDVLPSKIVLLHYKDADDIQQEFLSHTFAKDIPFLHVPQVLVLEKGVENEATVKGVALQMELEVSDVSSIKTPVDEDLEEEKVVVEKDSQGFGFVKEEDVADKEIEIDKEKEFDGEKEKLSTKEEKSNVAYIEEVEEDESRSSKLPSFAFMSSLSALPAIFKKIKPPKGLIPFSLAGGSQAMKIKVVAALIGLIVILVAFSYVYYNFILAAQVVVSTDKHVIEKEDEVTFSADATGDGIVKLQIIQKEVKGEESKNATGVKETGEKAKGEVTIYNKTDERKNFAKGTVVVGPNNLEFVTTDDISVASTSAFSTSLSSVKAKVEASEFGEEYNLASNSNFTVKSFSTDQYIAKNEGAISGGSKKEITVVSQKDLTDLLGDLTEKLEKEALDGARADMSSDEDIVPTALSFDVVDQEYSQKAGAESKTVKLTATISYSIGKYGGQDLESLISSFAEGDIPAGFELQDDESTIEVEDVKTEDDVVSGRLKVNAIYAPNINGEEIVSKITGKSVAQATEELESISGVKGVEIKFSRKLPIFPSQLPARTSNIQIEVEN